MADHEADLGGAGLQRPVCRYSSVSASVDLWLLVGSPLGSSSGFMPRVIKVAPACAIMISTYEYGKSFFRRMNLDGE